MYGAYWCSHCYDQKQTLGREAFERLPYVECDSNGVNSQRQTCKARGVKGCGPPATPLGTPYWLVLTGT